MTAQSQRRPRRPVRAVPDPKPTTVEPFYPMQMRVVLGGEPMTLTICHACAAVVPGGEKSQARHLEWHRLLQDAIEAALPR
jgi:hypothetical protein